MSGWVFAEVGRAMAEGAPPLRLGFAEPPLPPHSWGRGNANRGGRGLESLGLSSPPWTWGRGVREADGVGAGDVISNCPGGADSASAGFSLVAVLVFMLIVSAIVVPFAVTARTRLMIANNELE